MAAAQKWGSFFSSMNQGNSGGGGGSKQVVDAGGPSVGSLDYGQGNTSYSSAGMDSNSASMSAGASIMNNPSSDDFSQGMKYGYAGVRTVTAPLLAYRAAKQEKKLMQMQQDLSDLNAKAYQTAAEDVLRNGNLAVAGITAEAGQAKSAARVSQASAGIQISGSGSAAEVMTSMDIAKEMAVNQTLANAVTQSYGYKRKETQQRMNSMAIKATKDSISPWAAALNAFNTTSLSFAQSFGGGMGGGSAKGGSAGGATAG